jgi:uncharacterized protein (TIGR03382 family)
MKNSKWLDVRGAVCAAALIGACLPGIALAQAQVPASGGSTPPGLPPATLPRTGSATVDETAGVPAILVGGAAVLAGLVLRRRAQREPDRRRQ